MFQNDSIGVDVYLGLNVDDFVVIKLLLHNQCVLIVRDLAGVVTVEYLHTKVPFILLLSVIYRGNCVVFRLTLGFDGLFHRIRLLNLVLKDFMQSSALFGSVILLAFYFVFNKKKIVKLFV